MKKNLIAALFGVIVSLTLAVAGREVLAAPQVITPGQLPSTQEIVNPMRGQYEWLSNNYWSSTPNGWPVLDLYNRYTWRELETSLGV